MRCIGNKVAFCAFCNTDHFQHTKFNPQNNYKNVIKNIVIEVSSAILVRLECICKVILVFNETTLLLRKSTRNGILLYTLMT